MINHTCITINLCCHFSAGTPVILLQYFMPALCLTMLLVGFYFYCGGRQKHLELNCLSGCLENGNFSGRGYVVAMNTHGQLVTGTSNLLDLQCWAARHNLIVVEPFLNHRHFLFTFINPYPVTFKQLGDVFDRECWQEYSKAKKLSLTVTRDEFIREVSHYDKNVILVQMNTSDKEPCIFHWQKELGSVEHFDHLRIARSVCVSRNQQSVNGFDRIVFGDTLPKNTLVVFSDWRGDAKMPLDCGDHRQYLCLSPRVLKDAEAYTQEYLGGFGGYNAVFAQPEVKGDHSLLLDEMQIKLRDVKKRTSLSRVFLAFGHEGHDPSSEEAEWFHQTVRYNGRLSFRDWEKSFEKISLTSNFGYNALMQVEIMAHARCIILVGHHTNLMQYTLSVYKKNHPKQMCIETVGDSLVLKCE